MNKNKGFTLIELLVVIAIIGVLSSVVLALLSYAKNKGVDNSIKAGLNQVRSQADIYYNVNGTYQDVCSSLKDTTDPKGINSMIFLTGKSNGFIDPVRVDGVGASTTVGCNDTVDGWAAEIRLNGSDDYYCVDYNRKGIVTSSSISSGGTQRAFCQ